MSAKLLFTGNRRFVLEEALAANCQLAEICIIRGSHLERDLANGNLKSLPRTPKIVENKQHLLEIINSSSFDVLISNGCPFILPIANLPKAVYANIHPSCLPDLRGYDPVIGAVLHGRDAGATCHIMDAGVDTGPIISQVRIPYTDDLDVTTLYQLSFLAEKEAFKQALDRNFEPQREQPGIDNLMEYRRRPEDMRISFQESNAQILKKVRAFNNLSIGCQFGAEGNNYKVFGAEIMRNPYLLKQMEKYGEGEIGFCYENNIIFRKDGEVIRFSQIMPIAANTLRPGLKLF